jgi:hypothetical protein
MRVKLLHHASEWLSGDFEPPEHLVQKEYLVAWRVHRNELDGSTALKLQSGTGVWDAAGKLLLYLKRGGDLNWLNGFHDLLSLENVFCPCDGRKGVHHRLRRLETSSFRELQEIGICVPEGAVRYLVLNATKRKCLATWIEQTSWGYVQLDLETKAATRLSLRWKAPTLPPPAFSPDDRFIVACHYYKAGWWNDMQDDPAEYPSPGGVRKVSTITVQDAASGDVSSHDLLVKLPKGWMPERPNDYGWDMVWGPEFISAEEFNIWLPDDTAQVLRLPLPARVILERELRTTRPPE